MHANEIKKEKKTNSTFLSTDPRRDRWLLLFLSLGHSQVDCSFLRQVEIEEGGVG